MDLSLVWLISISILVFHCVLSQVRGPKCARMYSDKFNRDVYVLVGGFSNWQSLYKDDPLRVENYDPIYWDDI